ncbi:MAG: RDD family protein [Acidobacteriota bacterium]
MSRGKKSAEPSLPLFDLPLQADEDGGGQLPLAPPVVPPTASPGPAVVEPPSAHAPEGEMEPEPAFAVAAASEDVAEEDDLDEGPRLQDRLLAGVADAVAVLAAVGVMVLGSQLLGVRISLDQWRPFVVFGLLFSFPYAVIPLAFWGRTPGMAWVGHAALTLDDEPLTFAQTARRWVGAVLTLALAGLPLALSWGGGGSLADRISDSKTVVDP